VNKPSTGAQAKENNTFFEVPVVFRPGLFYDPMRERMD